MEIEKASVLTEAFSIRTAAGVDSATPGLKDVAYSCCSILLAVKLEQAVHRQTGNSYLWWLRVFSCGAGFGCKLVANPKLQRRTENLLIKSCLKRVLRCDDWCYAIYDSKLKTLSDTTQHAPDVHIAVHMI